MKYFNQKFKQFKKFELFKEVKSSISDGKKPNSKIIDYI